MNLRALLASVALGRLAAAQTTTSAVPWTTLSIDLPYPLATPLFSLAGQETAVLRAFSPIPCGRGGSTSFASTTTVTLPLDCQGAESLSFSKHVHPGCPMGVTHTEPRTVDWVTATPYTTFEWSCAPSCSTTALPQETGSDEATATATATATTVGVGKRYPPRLPLGERQDGQEDATCGVTAYPVSVLDVTVTLPVPSLEPTQTPPEVAVSLSAIHHADGRCSVQISNSAVVDGWRAQWCSDYYQYPTSYETTTTTAIGVDCDGCKYVWGGNMGVRCPQGYMSLTALAPVETSATSTLWIYDCLPTDEAGRETA